MLAEIQQAPMTSGLWAHQERAIVMARTNPSLLLDMEPGTGKTRTAIEIYRERRVQHGSNLKLLVLCPAIVVRQWRDEISQYAPELLREVVLLQGEGKKRIEKLRGPGNIFVTNYEALSMPLLAKEIFAAKFQFIIFDEIHRLKSPEGKRSKVAIQLADTVKHKLGLTGTLITNSHADVWAPIRLLRRHLFQDNFYMWRRHYMEDKNAHMPAARYFPAWHVPKHRERELSERVSQITISVKKEEVLKLPPLVKQTVYVEKSPQVARHYDDIEKKFVTELNNEMLTTDLAVTQVLRLQQIASGVLPMKSGETQIPCMKLVALRELLEDHASKHKILVWTNWAGTYGPIGDLIDQLGYSFTSIIGGQTTKERMENIDAFNRDPRVRVMLGNQAAGGIGLNLQVSSMSIYFSKGFSLEHDIQSQARNYRGGSERHARVVRVDIVTQDTIEEQIEKALREKMTMSQFLTSVKQERGKCI